MAIKHTKQSFIEKAKQVHGDKYNYDKVDYQGYYTKVIITCPIHGDFIQAPSNHLQGRGCKKCQMEAQRLTTKDFITKAREVHGNKYDYSKVDYKSGQDKVVIICPIHGEFSQKCNNHLHGNGCPKCRNRTDIKSTKSTPKVTTETFIEKARNIHGNKYDYSNVKYSNKRTKVRIICPIHGEFLQTPDDHVNKPSGCPKCGHNVYTQESFIEKCSQVHHNKYDYSKTVYKSVRDKVIITCPDHGDFEQSAHSHLTGAGCLQCRLKQQTKLFNRLCGYFPNENILFEVNRNIVPWIGQQRLDIYFPKYSIAIEYDGIQHSEPVGIFGGEKRFKQQQKLDAAKNELCWLNNCKLFRLAYNYSNEEFKNMCLEITKIMEEKV